MAGHLQHSNTPTRQRRSVEQSVTQRCVADLGQSLGEDVGHHALRGQILEDDLLLLHQLLDEVVAYVDVLGPLVMSRLDRHGDAALVVLKNEAGDNGKPDAASGGEGSRSG